MSWIQRIIEWFKSLFWKLEMDVAIVGLQYSGKSTYVKLLSVGKFDEDMIPTVGFNMKKVVRGNVVIKIWDVGGQPRFRSMWERYCKGVNCIIFMIDSADAAKFDAATLELHSLISNNALRGIPLLVLGNKADLPESVPSRELIQRLKLNEIRGREVSFYSISCRNFINIDVTLKWLTSHLIMMLIWIFYLIFTQFVSK